MIIGTESYRDMEKDITDIFDCAEEYLYENLDDFYNQCIDGLYLNDDMFNEKIDQFIYKNANLGMVDEVYVYHLARHVKEPTELLPLKELLLTSNSFSEFLADNDIYFKGQNGQLVFYYKQYKTTWKQILSGGNYNLLARRLGYLEKADFGINGFAFWPDIEKTTDEYYTYLQDGPEFLNSLGQYIKVNLCKKYKEKTRYYGIVFRVPVNELIFEGNEEIKTYEDKVRHLLRYSLKTLYGKHIDYPSSSNNPVLKMADNLKVKVDHCILIGEK